MIRRLAERTKDGFEWTDVSDPDPDELRNIAREYRLHETSVQDCLQPDHLPKYEVVGDYIFFIFRMHLSEVAEEADTVQELTNKIAIFMTDNCIITIHQSGWAEIERVKEMQLQNEISGKALQILHEIIRAGLLSYEQSANALVKEIEQYERSVFLKERKTSLLKGLYFLKRKVDVIRRLLILSFEIIDQIDTPEKSNTSTRDIRDLYIKLQNVYDSLSENTNHLLNIYFSIASQRTNQIIRVLTIFSVFFMPLTFIVGVYGMNFRVLPELEWKYGYPAVLLLMAIVTLSIYLWFKKKQWL